MRQNKEESGMENKKFTEPKIEVVFLSEKDVIATSNPNVQLEEEEIYTK